MSTQIQPVNGTMETNKIYQGDCLEVMKQIEDKSVDMIICDLPYGLTSCEWDRIIAFDKLWIQYKRIIKDKGVIILTSSQPFTTDLINSNREWFKYELIWEKTRNSNPSMAKSRPLPHHENILIFYNLKGTYNPIKEDGEKYKTRKGAGGRFAGNKVNKKDYPIEIRDGRYPKSIIKITSEYPNSIVHPTQKPLALFEYLIKTYSNKNDLVLDNCIGSGTTAVACKNTNRDFIGIEISKKYCKIANQRLNQEVLI